MLPYLLQFWKKNKNGFNQLNAKFFINLLLLTQVIVRKFRQTHKFIDAHKDLEHTINSQSAFIV